LGRLALAFDGLLLDRDGLLLPGYSLLLLLSG